MSSCSRVWTYGLTSRSRNRPKLSRIRRSCSASTLIPTCSNRNPAIACATGRRFGSAGFDRQRDEPDIALALLDTDQHPFLVALFRGGGELRDLLGAGELRLPDRDDQIARAQTLRRRGAVRRHLSDDRPLCPIRQRELLAELRRDLGELQTEGIDGSRRLRFFRLGGRRRRPVRVQRGGLYFGLVFLAVTPECQL